MADEKKKDGSQETRLHPRVDFFSRVHVIPEDGTPTDVFSANVSCGGMFLRSNRPLPTDKKVKLEFETNTGMVRVDEGEIVWNRSFDPASAGSQVSGMGIKFRSMSEQSRKNIETFIDEILDISLIPESLLNQPSAAVLNQPTKLAPGLSTSVQSKTPQEEPLSSDALPPLPRAPVILSPPEHSSPPERAASPRPLASQPLPSIPRTDIETDYAVDNEPTTVTDRAGALSNVDSSKSDFSGPNDFLQNVDERQTGSQTDDAPDGEEYMTLLSPPPRKRIFLFTGFVLLVAVVTFFTMFLIRPSVDDKSGLDGTGTAPRTTSRSKPSSVSAADARKNEPPDAGTATVSTQPVPGKSDSSAKSTSPSDKDTAVVNATKKPEVIAPAKVTKAESNGQPIVADNKETVTDQLEVGQPVFEQQPHGWQMVIKANRSLEIKHFTLNAPPRLAIDFLKASFTGKLLTVEPPIPAVAKLRVGKQERGVRFVLDFQGNEVPDYKIKVEPASITVSFSK
jgi:Localisation of periplasmic protein complexes./PilZ domain.